MATYDVIIENEAGAEVDRLGDVTTGAGVPAAGDLFTWINTSAVRKTTDYVVTRRAWRVGSFGRSLCIIYVKPVL